jgi:hypothetical protein
MTAPDLVSKRDPERALERTTHTLTVRLVGSWLGITGLMNAALFALLHVLPAAVADERPYSCRLFDDAQRQCAFGSCDRRVIERLERECLRDGGRP